MKMNWGTGITIFLMSFMAFILTMVVKAHQIESDLYAEDYYQQEVDYQQTIDSKARGNVFKDEIKYSINSTGDLEVICPDFIRKATSARLNFYRPDDASLDRNVDLLTFKGEQIIIDGSELVKGRYTLALKWRIEGVDYQVNQEFFR